MSPPPCLISKTFRRYASDNDSCGPVSCVRVGQWGTEWADRNRSQLMFFAFWLSFTSFILLIIPLASLSYNESTVVGTNWSVGSIDLPSGSSFDYYIGLKLVSVRCSGGDACPDITSFKWSDSTCTSNYGCNDCCKDCKDSVAGTVTSAVMGLITMLPQMGTNLQRSRRDGDLNCQKYMAIFTGFVGIFSNLGTISNFQAGCFNDLPTSYDPPDGGGSYDISYRVGPAIWCLIFATILKVFDIIFNVLLPVPTKGYWGDESDTIDDPVLDKAHIKEGSTRNPLV